MKLKYITATGALVCMGELIGLKAEPEETIADVSFGIPSDSLEFYTFNGSVLVRKEQSVIDQILARQNFDLILFQTDLANLLPTLSDPNLRWEFAALNTYAQNKDFEGMSGYMDMLVSSGVALQADDDSVIALLTKQGIVL